MGLSKNSGFLLFEDGKTDLPVSDVFDHVNVTNL